MRGWRKVLSAGILVLAGLLGGVLLTEAAYRVARRFVCIGDSPGYFEKRDWGWTHRPNAALWVYSCVGSKPEYRTWVEINSQGLRDREIAYAKPPGTRRVLLLGDSITEAVQVPLEQTFATLVEQRMWSDGYRVEVVNGGHAGFGTDNEWLFYRQEGRRYDPDLVVVVFNFQNDVLENSQALSVGLAESAGARLGVKPWFAVGPDGALAPLPPAPRLTADRWEYRLAAQLYVVRLLQRFARPPTNGPLRIPLLDQLYAPQDETWTAAWRVTERLLQQLRTDVQHDAAKLAVVLMPSREMVQPATLAALLALAGVSATGYDVERPHDRMTSFLRADGTPFVDLLPTLRAEPPGTTFFAWDPHMTAAGHAAVATPLAAFIEEQLGK